MSDPQPEGLKILIVDDDSDDIVLIKDYLSEGISRSRLALDVAMEFQEALDMVNKGYDVCILDYLLGEENGLELLKSMKQAGVKTPVIFLTGRGDEEVAVTALKAGASDYLVKGHLSPDLLAHSIRYVLELSRKEAERRAALEALKKSEEDYRVLVNNLPAVVFKGYADWSIDFYDDKVERFTGYRKKDFESREMKWCDVILPEDLEKAKKSFIKALKTNNLYRREYRIIDAAGKIHWIHAKGHIVSDENGRIDYVAGVFFDVTELKEARIKRKEAEMERERVIAELQEALAQVKTLKGLLPICANCKKIRDKKGSWRQMESYIKAHSQADFSHSICPDCARILYPEYVKDDK